VIAGVGPAGHFLQEEHTLRHFRRELWMPKLLTRQHYDVWRAEGAKDMAQRVHEKVRNVVENHEPTPLSDKTVAALAELKKKGEKELAG
jgi:trimethylamine--corrinoid protein Co-methyltransferase